ncbi:hypothetical protein W911_11325 [Hyphomicrobium nitrativorans NL23]|uniref:Uncharacterized protein n=1 Tax=Hyphomicrobium nitrativorans NL23 TaxID=1029756 RepID=V5SJR5_9HYPH|nr:hypothetical protein W911_11325 [Hyphomicrobium nitrativorans NL23]
MISEETAAKIVYRILAVLAGFALCMALALAWDWGLVPRKAVSTGAIVTKNGLSLSTRKYEPFYVIRTSQPQPVGKKRLDEEVRLPSGRWIDCRSDCLRAYEQHTKSRSIPVSEFQPDTRR